MTRLILCLLLILIIPISLCMDPSFFWENGPVEMAQNIVLALGTITACYWVLKENSNKGVWFTGCLLFFIAMLRELSWGRVFFVKGMDADGPIIAEKSDLWFGPYINVFVGLLLLLLIASLIYNRKQLIQIGKLWINDKQSIIYTILMVVLLALASLVFDKNAIKAISDWHQGLEEMSELTSYWAAFTLAVRLHYLEGKK